MTQELLVVSAGLIVSTFWFLTNFDVYIQSVPNNVKINKPAVTISIF
jgi:hypothetical protein